VQAAVKARRLVTLTGVARVGKTRLALEVAGRLVDEFPDGVGFFELAMVDHSASKVAQSIKPIGSVIGPPD